MQWAVDTAVVCGLVGATTGLAVPRLIAWIPEPDPRPDDNAERGSLREKGQTVRAAPASPAKEPYAAIAALPGLRLRTSLAGALAAATVGASVGWSWSLLFLLYLVPV